MEQAVRDEQHQQDVDADGPFSEGQNFCIKHVALVSERQLCIGVLQSPRCFAEEQAYTAIAKR